MNLLHTIETTIKWAVPATMIIVAAGVLLRIKVHEIFGF